MAQPALLAGKHWEVLRRERGSESLIGQRDRTSRVEHSVSRENPGISSESYVQRVRQMLTVKKAVWEMEIKEGGKQTVRRPGKRRKNT